MKGATEYMIRVAKTFDRIASHSNMYFRQIAMPAKKFDVCFTIFVGEERFEKFEFAPALLDTFLAIAKSEIPNETDFAEYRQYCIDRITAKTRVALTLSPSDLQLKQIPIKDLFILAGKIIFRARWNDPRFSTVTFYSNRFGISDSATAMRALNQSVNNYTDMVTKMQTIIQDESR